MDRYLWKVAVHEAGHCLGNRLAGTAITSATIIPTSRWCDGSVTSKEWMKREDDVISSLLGHAAELEFGFDGFTFGHLPDYEHAANRLKATVKWRKSDDWALAHGYVENGKPRFLFHRIDFMTRPRGGAGGGSASVDYKSWRGATRVTKKEWKPEFNRMRQRARRVAKKHHAYIEHVANLLMEHKTLTDDMVPQL